MYVYVKLPRGTKETNYRDKKRHRRGMGKTHSAYINTQMIISLCNVVPCADYIHEDKSRKFQE